MFVLKYTTEHICQRWSPSTSSTFRRQNQRSSSRTSSTSSLIPPSFHHPSITHHSTMPLPHTALLLLLKLPDSVLHQRLVSDMIYTPGSISVLTRVGRTRRCCTRAAGGRSVRVPSGLSLSSSCAERNCQRVYSTWHFKWCRVVSVSPRCLCVAVTTADYWMWCRTRGKILTAARLRTYTKSRSTDSSAFPPAEFRLWCENVISDSHLFVDRFWVHFKELGSLFLIDIYYFNETLSDLLLL